MPDKNEQFEDCSEVGSKHKLKVGVPVNWTVDDKKKLRKLWGGFIKRKV